MATTSTNSTRHSSLSYMALRKWLGILGLALPVLIWIFNDFELKSSISHFYYSSSSVLFTGFMFTFGIFLIFYPGRDDKTDRISDNWVTTIGGLGAIFTALIPTAYNSACEDSFEYKIVLEEFCGADTLTTQYIHNDSVYGYIHLGCAAVFLGLMGYMSFARFTKGDITRKMKIFYKFCAIMVWAPLVTLAVIFLTKIEGPKYIVFICECVSLGFFGIAWLVKGKGLKRFGFH
jgi:hypothetical protein